MSSQTYLFGAWNPSTRTWSGRWSHDKNFPPGTPHREFNFNPKAETSVVPKNPCEQCRHPISGQDKYYGCSMCDKWGIHVKCSNTTLPFTCMSCIDIMNRNGRVPPLARTWIGYSDQESESGTVTRSEDAIRMEFIYKPETNPQMLAAITGRGENMMGHYTVRGYLSRSNNGESFDMRIMRKYETSHQPAVAPQAPQQAIPGTAGYGTAVASAEVGSMASRRRKADDTIYEDQMDKRLRLNGSAAGSSSASKRAATLVTSVGVEGNISSLIDVWRAVAKVNDPSLGIVCLSVPSTTLPLKALLRLYSNSDQLSQILRSSSAMAACSSACTAVDIALEHSSGTMSCASLDRKSQYAFPCAVAAAYSMDRYGKSVVVIDLCPKPTYLFNALQNMPGITVMAPRDSNDPRSFRDTINGGVIQIRASPPDIIIVSTILGEFDAGEYAYAMDAIASFNIPLVVVVEDVTSQRATSCANAMMEVMVRRFNGDTTPLSAIIPQQAAVQTFSLPSGPIYKAAGQVGMYQSMLAQQNKSSTAATTSQPPAATSTMSKSSVANDKKSVMQSTYGGSMSVSKPPAPNVSSVGLGNKPNMGVTPPQRAGNQPVAQAGMVSNKLPPQPPPQTGMLPQGKAATAMGANGYQRSSSNGNHPGMYSPKMMPKQLSSGGQSGRQPSPLPRTNATQQPVPVAYSSSDRYLDDIPSDLLEPIPYNPMEELQGGVLGTSSGTGGGNNGTSNSAEDTNASSLLPPLSAPPLDRQDSWDLGAESPRPPNKQFDYITASFKS